jgi:ribosomal protein L37AE/L43A
MRFCEICTKCDIGLMIHTQLYTWKCNHCGFSYKIDPSGKVPKITILNRGKYDSFKKLIISQSRMGGS